MVTKVKDLLFKFRTMKNEDNPRDDFTNINDKRITYFGKVLRQTRLDEISNYQYSYG